jgi:hypothetical protein
MKTRKLSHHPANARGSAVQRYAPAPIVGRWNQSARRARRLALALDMLAVSGALALLALALLWNGWPFAR